MGKESPLKLLNRKLSRLSPENAVNRLIEAFLSDKSALSCGFGNLYSAPDKVTLEVATSKGAFFRQPKISPFSVRIRLEYLPMISA